MTKIIPIPADLWYNRLMMKQMGIKTRWITADCLIQEVVERYPQTVAIFVRHRLQCVGCLIAPYHTIADSAREYALPLEPLLDDFNQAIAA